MLHRLRQVDVKAEHFERQLQRAEQERDAWEKKYEVSAQIVTIGRRISSQCIFVTRLQEAEDKLRKSKAELDDLVQSMGSL